MFLSGSIMLILGVSAVVNHRSLPVLLRSDMLPVVPKRLELSKAIKFISFGLSSASSVADLQECPGLYPGQLQESSNDVLDAYSAPYRAFLVQ